MTIITRGLGPGSGLIVGGFGAGFAPAVVSVTPARRGRGSVSLPLFRARKYFTGRIALPFQQQYYWILWLAQVYAVTHNVSFLVALRSLLFSPATIQLTQQYTHTTIPQIKIGKPFTQITATQITLSKQYTINQAVTSKIMEPYHTAQTSTIMIRPKRKLRKAKKILRTLEKVDVDGE